MTPTGLLVHEQHVVGRADIGLVFAHGMTEAGMKSRCFLVLHDPAGLRELRVDAVAGLLFGVLVFGHDAPLSASARS